MKDMTRAKETGRHDNLDDASIFAIAMKMFGKAKRLKKALAGLIRLRR